MAVGLQKVEQYQLGFFDREISKKKIEQIFLSWHFLR